MTNKKIREKQKTLTPDEVLSSSEFRAFAEKSINAVLLSTGNRSGLNLKIYNNPSMDLTACTDGKTCSINIANDIFCADTLKEKSQYVYGGIFHELGHVMYTCFSELERKVKLFEAGNLIIFNPSKDEEEVYKEIKEHLKAGDSAIFNVPLKDFLIHSYCNINNCIEDARIERLLLKQNRFSGFVAGLNALREKQEAELLNSFTNDSNKQNSIVKNLEAYHSIILFYNMVLLYSKYGKEPYDYKHDFEAFEKAKPIIDQMVDCHEIQKFSENCCRLIICIWPLVKDLLEEMGFPQEGSSGDSSSDGKESSGSTSSSSNGSSQGSSSDSNRSSEGSSSDSKDSSEGSGEQQSESQNTDSSNQPKDDESESSQDDSNGSSNESANGSENNSSGNQNEGESKDENGNSSDNEISNQFTEEDLKKVLKALNDAIEEMVNAEDHNTRARDSSQKETKENNAQKASENNSPKNERGADGLERMIEQIATQIAERQVEDETQNANASEIADAISAIAAQNRGFAKYSGTNIVERNPSRERVDVNSQAIKKATKEIQRHLQQDMRTGYAKKKYSGKKFKAQNIVNRDLRYFDDKGKKKDLPKIKVGLVIDESGSMGCDNRYINARRAAVTLYDIFKEVPNLDIAIYGHNTRGSNVNIIQYANFGEKRRDTRERLASISFGGGNIDIVPIKVLGTKLLQEQAEQRIMFIISDGRPYSYVTDMTPEEELTIAANELSRKGIEIIVAAIGDDRDLLESIYKNQKFLNISDSALLPKKLIEVIKRKL